MDEFVFLCVCERVRGAREAAEKINHIAGREGADPDIAVNDPHNTPLRFSVASAHVPDLGIRPKVVESPIVA